MTVPLCTQHGEREAVADQTEDAHRAEEKDIQNEREPVAADVRAVHDVVVAVAVTTTITVTRP